MTPFESTISIEKLRRLVSMNQDTGDLTWNKRVGSDFPFAMNPERACNSWNSNFAGMKAFSHMSGNGYLHGGLFNKKVTAHRIVFALYYGKWPDNTIDHINGNRTDNRPSNLRDVFHIENMRNQPKSKASSTGVTGVYFDSARGLYQAHITVGGKKKALGRFGSVEAAAAARDVANKEFEFHRNHGRDKT